ncbi:CU044_5270 family protein [Streptomyces sp. NPDC046465]|uniref:CU044_5270 family protein n=1 Tax=Streptomyces sp. NPDC046465 TaxID=3155810 RepID=UPI0034005E38
MNELDELRDWDAGAPPLDDGARHRARVRLFAAMNEQAAPVRPLWRRPVLRVAVAGTVAAAVAGTVLTAVSSGDDEQARAKPPGNSAPSMREVSARTVLYGAAAYERKHERTVAPRDDQYIYTKEITKEIEKGTGKVTRHVDEDWRSVDGSKRSWIMEIGKGWWSEPLKPDETMWPPQDWGTLKKLSTDPEKLILSLLHKTGPDDKNDSLDEITEQEWSDIHFSLAGLLKLVPVTPKGLRPAAYEALSMVPGVKAIPGRQDAKGRTGVAITYDDPTRPEGSSGFGGYFIFEPRTYAFLGSQDIRATGDAKNPKTYTQLSYLDSWAITDKVKQRP